MKAGLDLQGIANFLVIALNGATPLYAASKDPAVWQQTLAQLHFYLDSLRQQSLRGRNFIWHNEP